MASPAQAQPPELVDVPLSLFGGIHTGVAPPDLPEGLSPDNQDMVYVPGDTFSRPCLSRVSATPFGEVPALYDKTYVMPDGTPLTLAMDANGNLYVENVVNAPGEFTTLATVTAGVTAFSASAFGREYIALSDLLSGQWCPLQYDGEFLDRVTQDGPGVGPACANVTPSTATIGNSGAGASYTIVSATPTDPVPAAPGSGSSLILWSRLTIVTSAANALTTGDGVTLSGITGLPFYEVWPNQVVEIVNPTTFKVSYWIQLPPGTAPPVGTGGTAVTENPSLSRANGVVTATTTAPHGFAEGNQVQISGIVDTVSLGGSIASISLDNNGVVTVVTTDPHGLPGTAQISIEGVASVGSAANFNGAFQVASVPGPNTFTYQLGGVAGTGTGGNVYDTWNITAFIQSIPSPTTFTYQDIGPNRQIAVSGVATVIGQISPGNHGVVVMFLTRQGAITRPSPEVQFVANGGDQMAVSNIALGPANVVARILGFTGAGGDNYFIIPAIPQVGGTIVGTWTIIPDNTSTSAVIDFSDNTLFNGIAIDQIGNDLFDQRVLVAPVGFYSYASRLACWGDYNAIQNLLNMTLAGGNLPSQVTNLAGSGATSGSGTAWTNPSNIASLSSFANANIGFNTTSQLLAAGTYGFAVSGLPRQIGFALSYYWTGGGNGTPGSAWPIVTVQLLKAGVPFGVPQTFWLATTSSSPTKGSSSAPLSVSLTFPAAGLTASDINNAAFGFQISVSSRLGPALNLFVNAGFLTPQTNSPYPLGWSSVGTSGGTPAIVSSTLPGIYELYQMTSGGGENDCMISQPAWEDEDGTAILSPLTPYSFRLYLSYAAGIVAGSLVADFFSPSQGLLSSATVPLAATAFSGFAIVDFSGDTPAAIPQDALMRVYLQNVTNGAVVTIGELSSIYAQKPQSGNVSFWSYVINPEGIAQTTGGLGSADDPSDIKCFSVQRNSTLLKTYAGTHIFQDNDFEPYQWVVNNLSRSVGACSIRAGDPGQFGTGDAAEDWDLTANQNGLYLFSGGNFWKISQEIAKGDPTAPVVTWDDINWEYEHTICVKNDPKNHRAYVLAPVQGATQPNLIFVLDYRELDTAADLAAAPGLKIGLTGKMLSTDKTRKWTRWNVSANCADILVRPGNDKEMTFAGGTRNGAAYGNLYTLDPAKLHDDDYGQFFPYYDTYGFVNHELEQALGIGTGRKLMKKITAFITGVGYVSIIPLVNSLQNPLPATTLRPLSQDSTPANLQGQDLEWTVGIRGERIFLRIQVQPAPGSIDVQLKIQKLIAGMMKDPVVIHRASAV